MYALKKKKKSIFPSPFQNLECLLYVARASTAVLVTENSDGKDMW